MNSLDRRMRLGPTKVSRRPERAWTTRSSSRIPFPAIRPRSSKPRLPILTISRPETVRNERRMLRKNMLSSRLVLPAPFGPVRTTLSPEKRNRFDS